MLSLFVGIAVTTPGCQPVSKDKSSGLDGQSGDNAQSNNRNNPFATENAVGLNIAVWPLDETRLALPATQGNPAQQGALRSLTLGEALAPYAHNNILISEETRIRWQTAGMMFALVPRTDLGKIENALRIAAAVQQQQFTFTPQWTQAFRGPFTRIPQSILLDDGQLTDISQGAFRLLMRCYPAQEGNLRLDLVPQHIQRAALAADPRPTMLTLETPIAPRAAVDEGVIFNSLLLETVIPAGYALVIYSSTVGTPVTTPVAEPETPNSENMPDAPAIVEPTRSFGPDIPDSLTLGDGLLTDVLGGGKGSLRAVLIFAPRAR